MTKRQLTEQECLRLVNHAVADLIAVFDAIDSLEELRPGLEIIMDGLLRGGLTHEGRMLQ
jgi:hypothetical protein